MKLNFGCGYAPKEGYLNLDKDQCNLDKLPLSFADKSIDEIYCSHVLEHLNVKPQQLMAEFMRIIKDEGMICIKVPHFSWHNAFDEDHERFFNINAFSYLHKSNPEKDNYAQIDRSVQIKFYKNWRFWEYFVEEIVNTDRRIAMIWESTFLVHLFPANELHFLIRKEGVRRGGMRKSPPL